MENTMRTNAKDYSKILNIINIIRYSCLSRSDMHVQAFQYCKLIQKWIHFVYHCKHVKFNVPIIKFSNCFVEIDGLPTSVQCSSLYLLSPVDAPGLLSPVNGLGLLSPVDSPGLLSPVNGLGLLIIFETQLDSFYILVRCNRQ